jgi:hypothetical protein
VIVALGVYLLFQVHALAFHGYQGQDWTTHIQWIAQAAEDPWKFFNHYEEDRTNPPLYHLLAGAVKRLVASPNDLPGIGLMNVVFGFIGACCTYGVIGRLIASPLLRVAAMVLFLFLPFAMIHAEVVASDALATPLFWVLDCRFTTRRDRRPGPGVRLRTRRGAAPERQESACVCSAAFLRRVVCKYRDDVSVYSHRLCGGILASAFDCPGPHRFFYRRLRAGGPVTVEEAAYRVSGVCAGAVRRSRLVFMAFSVSGGKRCLGWPPICHKIVAD